MAKRPDLVVQTGDLKGCHFSVGEGGLRLGRSSSNDIHVPDEELSRNHCLFQVSGETGLRVTDLSSANGTSVNGAQIGNESVELKEGDVIEVGSTVLTVGEPKRDVASSVVDLGLSSSSESAAPGADGETPKGQPKTRRSPLMNALWAVAVLVAVGAIAAILLVPPQKEAKPVVRSVVETPTLREVVYEKVQANASGIFRYAFSAVAGGKLTVKIDDTANNRHMAPKTKDLSPAGLQELNGILPYRKVVELDSEYTGMEPDPPALDSLTLKVVYSTGVKTVSVVNTQEPDEFAALREKLEAFSKSELGVWAIAYSRERLIELAESAVRLGDAKWEDRDVNYGNLASAIVAYREAQFYLETVDPKPPCMKEALDGFARARTELDKRYTDQRFRADRALNLSQWETARDELRILLEMVPDRKDPRNRDASQKLVSAESNLKKKGTRK